MAIRTNRGKLTARSVRLVPAEGIILERILETTGRSRHDGLNQQAFARLDAAQRTLVWARRHQRRVALVENGEVLASAQLCDLTGMLDRRALSIRGIGAVFADPGQDDSGQARMLVERLLEDAARDDADIALLFLTPDLAPLVSKDFALLPMLDVELTVAASSRHGAPMTLVRGGEDRDMAAIVAMGQARADHFRFHLTRDVDFVKGAIARRRLIAGLAPAGVRQLRFVIAEEGITAAAYVVITIEGDTWTIEECGDRDVSGARVGAILQALIAREPAERRPRIVGTLPPGFVPPQFTIVSATPSANLLARVLRPAPGLLTLSSDDVLYWRSDMF